MNPLALVAFAAVVLAVLTAAAGVLVAARARRRTSAEADAARAQVAALAARVEELSAAVEQERVASAVPAEYLITSLHPVRLEEAAGEEGGRPGSSHQRSTIVERAVLGLVAQRRASPGGGALTAAAVRAVALAHGVRRALDADNRDRISLEMRRATRRSRRERLREVKEARRVVRREGAA